jgi:hypothetical protein
MRYEKVELEAPRYVLAIDFDGTIFESDYPKIGMMRPDAKKIINELYWEGFGIVINTCREGLALADAIRHLQDAGIKYHYINSNFPHLIHKYQADTRKISADIYIDDKCLTGLPPWKNIYTLVMEMKDKWEAQQEWDSLSGITKSYE